MRETAEKKNVDSYNFVIVYRDYHLIKRPPFSRCCSFPSLRATKPRDKKRGFFVRLSHIEKTLVSCLSDDGNFFLRLNVHVLADAEMAMAVL